MTGGGSSLCTGVQAGQSPPGGRRAWLNVRVHKGDHTVSLNRAPVPRVHDAGSVRMCAGVLARLRST